MGKLTARFRLDWARRPARSRRAPGVRWVAWPLVLWVLTSFASPVYAAAAGGLPRAAVPAEPSCSAIISETILLALVDQHYPNASLVPAKPVAENSTLSLWEDVCRSGAFASAYANTTNRTIAASFHVGDQNYSAGGYLIGSLFASFSLLGRAACPTGAIGYPAGYPCQEADRWTANLSTDAVTGRQWSLTSNRFVPCQTPQQNQTNLAAVQGFYPNPAQQPPEATAEAEVTGLWGEVCTSIAYYDAYWAHSLNGSIRLNGSMSEWTSTSDLFVKWQVYWGALPCPVAPPAGAISNGCTVWESWTADLVAENYTGPTFGYEFAFNGTGPPHGGSSGNATREGGFLFGLTTNAILAGSGGAIVLVAVVLVLVRRPGPPQGPDPVPPRV